MPNLISLNSHAMGAAKPYLDWLDQDLPPPSKCSFVGWTRAANLLIARGRAVRNQIAHGGDTAALATHLVAYDRIRAKFNALINWAEFTGERTARVHMTALKASITRANAGWARLEVAAGRGKAMRVVDGLLRRRKVRLTGKARAVAQDIRDDWKRARDGRTGTSHATQRMAERHYLREEQHSLQCAEDGVWLSRGLAQELPASERARARAAARKRGEPRGWYVSADTDLGTDALAHLSCRATREQLWRQKQTLKETARTVSQLLAKRQEEAREHGHATYANFALDGRCVTSPKIVMGLLEETLDGLVSARQALSRRLQQQAERDGLGTVEPWDRAWLIERLKQRCRFSKEPGHAWTVDVAMDTVVPQLLSIGGWRVDARTTVDEGRGKQWAFSLSRRDGRRARVYFAPYQPRATQTSSAWGYMTLLRESLDHATPMASVVLSIPAGSRWLNHSELTLLCHETGHLLHYLAQTPGDVTGYSMRFADDVVEFPSQLLEQMALDPTRLAAWAQQTPGSDPLAKRPTFWRQWLSVQLEFESPVRWMMDAWMDLAVHRETLKEGEVLDIDALWQHACDRFQHPTHPDDRQPYVQFSWGDYAASEYSYTLGQGLTALVTPTREDGMVDGTALEQRFADLLDNVLTTSLDGRGFNRAWAAWWGETTVQSLHRAMVKQAWRLRRTARYLAKL